MGKIVCRRCPSCLLYHSMDVLSCECGADLQDLPGEPVDDLILPVFYGDITPRLPVYVQKCPVCRTEHYQTASGLPIQSCRTCRSNQIALVHPSLFVSGDDPSGDPGFSASAPAAPVPPVPVEEPAAPSAHLPADEADTAADEAAAAFWLSLLRGEPAVLPGQNADAGAGEAAPASALSAHLLRLARTVDAFPRTTGDAACPTAAFKAALLRHFSLTSASGIRYRPRRLQCGYSSTSVLMLCTDPAGRDLDMRIYYPSVNGCGNLLESRIPLLDYMATPDGQAHTQQVLDIGLVTLGGSSYYFELMPHAPERSFSQGSPMEPEELIELTGQLNEALDSLHAAGIVHRALCPDALRRIDGCVVLGGFPLRDCRVPSDPDEPVWEDAFHAPVSADPDQEAHGTADDYFALGVTLASLYEGRTAFGTLIPADYRRAIRSRQLPLQRQHPKQRLLLNLIHGLCHHDPAERFGCEDVCKWLKNPSHAGGNTIIWPDNISILNDSCSDEASMFDAITRDRAHWDAALSMLYDGQLEKLFKPFHRELAVAAGNTAQTWGSHNRDKGLTVFLRKLYPAGPLVWQGRSYHSLAELSSAMIADADPAAFSELLQQECVSHWLKNAPGLHTPEEDRELVLQIELLAMQAPVQAFWWFAFSFVPRPNLKLCGQTVSDFPGLLDALFRSPAAFYELDGCTKLMSPDDGADLYGFLYSLGHRRLIEDTWNDIRSCAPFDQACSLFSMLDQIAREEGADPTRLRRFLVRFGPLGIASYTKSLAEQDDPAIYTALDGRASVLLSQIREFSLPSDVSVRELLAAYAPLRSLIEDLRQCMSSNPFSIGSGLFDHRGVLCSNLKGCFIYEIFGTAAPLGFSSLLNENTQRWN